jgi:ABC-type nitrate/sulfonate/bicarbonate transport system ATPase subunit
MIEVKNLTAYYGKTPIIRDFSLYLDKGDILGVTGTNGAGKTSLIKILAGINDEVKYDKNNIVYTNTNPKVSYVHQDFQKGLLPWFSVYKNIALPLIIEGNHNEKDCVIKAKELQEIYKSSGGQKQRIAILRALIKKPDILLMDEPFSAIHTLPEKTELDFRYNVLKYLTNNKITTLFISHDSKELTYLSTKILFCYRDTTNEKNNQPMHSDYVTLVKRNNRKSIFEEDNELDALIEGELSEYFLKYHNNE